MTVFPVLLWVKHWKSGPGPGELGQFVILLMTKKMKSFFLGWRHSEDNRPLQSLQWQGIISGGEFPKPWSESRKRSMNLPGEQGRKGHSKKDQHLQRHGGYSIWVKQRSKEQQEGRREEMERFLILEPDFLVTKQQVTHIFICKS